MSKARKIAIAAPSTGDEEWQALREPLSTGWLTQGPKVAEFETAFAARHGTRHAVASSSGTTALHLALAALGIGPGDEVIVPAFTWVATASAVLHCGATPIFVDVNDRTYNLAIARVADAITAKTRAIVPVHLFGLCADMDSLGAASTGIPLVEDAACAAGAEYKGRPAGSLGGSGVFSFHPRKVITTGEGGMLTTDDGELAERARTMRNHGAPEFEHLGFNYRMTDLQAAVGLVQLDKLDTLTDERSKWAGYYQRELAAVEWLQTPEPPTDGKHAWQAYVCIVDPDRAPCSRDELMSRLAERGIATRQGTQAVHMLPHYRERFGLAPEDFPVAKMCDQQSLAIPLHGRMSPDDYEYVVEVIKAIG